ncbi:MAG: hypothetical protein K8F91_14270, partial [Candidatus Obscuribacterales bacterium]|nr:hypothetical protein [Candidatus Obscuribacterales bacterium]
TLFGSPQDIEWAIQDDVLYIVQSRSITSISQNKVDIFDNSNIGESYPGITTPLTFSLARVAYQHVYEQFCLLMGVSAAKIEANKQIFPAMLGFIKGRIYYNLLNWYRLLSLFPGYKTNRAFMEQMMGVKEGIADYSPKSESKPLSLAESIKDKIELIFAICGLLYRCLTINTSIKSFETRLQKALSKADLESEALKKKSITELVSSYRNLENELLTKWDAPIVNDFFAMMFFGILKKLTSSWIKEEGLTNQLLCGETGMVSTEPTQMINEMAEIVVANSLTENLQENKELDRILQAYLNKFGDRTVGELKLESQTHKDNPEALLASIIQQAKLIENGNSYTTSRIKARKQRLQAQKKVQEALKGNFIKQIVFFAILKQARERIRDRENLRFHRTRVFGAVRAIFVELGKRLAQKELLENERDIFYLEIEEVLRFVEGTASTTDLAGLCALRKKQWSSYHSEPQPPDRFLSRGGVNMNTIEVTGKITSINERLDGLKGLGCCPGIVKGKVKVVADPEGQNLDGADILVARRTDPGWITLIAQSRAIVVEYGSLLSHTAIVARELGIPTVVSVSQATKLLATGDVVEVDGLNGLVQIVERIEPLPSNSRLEVVEDIQTSLQETA